MREEKDEPSEMAKVLGSAMADFVTRIKTPFSIPFMKARVEQDTGLITDYGVYFDFLEHFREKGEFIDDDGKTFQIMRGKPKPWWEGESYWIEYGKRKKVL